MKHEPLTSITVSAPGKLMLFGEHAVVYGRPCIVTAIDQRLTLSVELVAKPEFILNAPDLGISSYQKPLSDLGKGEIPRGAGFIEKAVDIFHKSIKFREGININTAARFSGKFGFGSSSAATVGVLKALALIFTPAMSPETLFTMAYQTVHDVQKRGSGFDVASAVYGGTILYTKGQRVKAVNIRPFNLVVGYSGEKGDTVKLLSDIAGKYEKESGKLERIFDAITKLTEEAETKLVQGDLERVGRLMDFNQEYLRNLGVSTARLEEMISAAKEAGAWGAKLSGAGGGDCMIAVCPEDKQEAVEKAIEKASGEIVRVGINAPGVGIETTDDQEELFIVVDDNDNILGYRTRYDCHHDKSLIHRAVGVGVFNDRGQILLQKRSMTKDLDAGLYGLSSAGHLTLGDTYESAARRELEEELGIDSPLEYVGKYLYEDNEETEMDVIYRTIHNGPFKFNKKEIDSVAFVDPKMLSRKMLSKELVISTGTIQSLKLLGVL
jgi:mevalonate kinase